MSIAQEGNYFGAGFTVGSKSIYNKGGVFAFARLFKHFDIDFGYAHGTFIGNGYSGGLSLVPLNTNLQPFIGAQYSKHAGSDEVSVTIDGNTTNFKVKAVEFFYAKGGLMYHMQQEGGNRGAFFSLTFSYRHTYYNNYQASYVDGYIPYRDNELNKLIGDNFGVSISIILFVGTGKGS